MESMRAGTTMPVAQDQGQQGFNLTKALLGCGVVAGPIYVCVALIQALTRPGFDITHHDVSVLSNGNLGWIQISNFILTGLLTVAGAFGIAKAMNGGLGRVWGPLLIGVYGAALACAGVFVADPALGFPPGTPMTDNTVSWHGALHLLCAAIGFFALIASTFVFSRRFAAFGRRAWSVYSAASGTIFLIGFVGILVGRPIALVSGLDAAWSASVLGLWAGVIAGWAWISAICARGAMIR